MVWADLIVIIIFAARTFVKIRKFPLIQLQTGRGRERHWPATNSDHHRHPATLMKYVQWVLGNSRKNPSNIRRCGRTHMFTYGHVAWWWWLHSPPSLSESYLRRIWSIIPRHSHKLVFIIYGWVWRAPFQPVHLFPGPSTGAAATSL